jgi:hypothetical protein
MIIPGPNMIDSVTEHEDWAWQQATLSGLTRRNLCVYKATGKDTHMIERKMLFEIRLTDRREKVFALASTVEEVMAFLQEQEVKNRIERVTRLSDTVYDAGDPEVQIPRVLPEWQDED